MEGDRVVNIGHNVKCVKCGKDFISGDGGMLCESCCGETEQYYCASCDCRINDDVYWLDWATYGEETVCENCFRAYVVQCEHCHRPYYISDNIIQKSKDDKWLCSSCRAAIEELSNQKKPTMSDKVFNLLISQDSSEFRLSDMAYGVIIE